jgi:hypothetical protein
MDGHGGWMGGWYEEIPRCGCGLAVVVAAEDGWGSILVSFLRTAGRGAGAAVRLRGIAAPETWAATSGGAY